MIFDRSGKGSGGPIAVICLVFLVIAGFLIYKHRDEVMGTGMVSEQQALTDYQALPAYAQEILAKNYQRIVEMPPDNRTRYRLADGTYQSCTLGRVVRDCLDYYAMQRKEVWLEGVVNEENGRTLVLFRMRPVMDRRRVAGGGAQTVVDLDVASMFGMATSSYGSLYIERAPAWSGLTCKVAVDGTISSVSEKSVPFEDDSLFFKRTCYPCRVTVINPASSDLKKGDEIDALFWPDLYPPSDRELVTAGASVGAAFLNRDIRVGGGFQKGGWIIFETVGE